MKIRYRPKHLWNFHSPCKLYTLDISSVKFSLYNIYTELLSNYPGIRCYSDSIFEKKSNRSNWTFQYVAYRQSPFKIDSLKQESDLPSSDVH